MAFRFMMYNTDNNQNLRFDIDFTYLILHWCSAWDHSHNTDASLVFVS